MKFLIFNVTVAAALVYLLATDRAEVQNTAGRIHDAATEMKQAAGRMVDRGRSLVGRTPAGTPARTPSRATPSASPTPKPATMAPAAGARGPLPMRAARTDRQGRGEAAPPDIRHVDSVAPRAATVAATGAKEAAALRRRKEILRGIDPAVLTPEAKPEAETAQRALSPAERRKRLYALSEEMELFYARTLGK